ncbi:MAG: hypothetical protein WCV88_02880 [Patescibacteria group bacterium]|jgi:hypothetical protein
MTEKFERQIDTNHEQLLAHAKDLVWQLAERQRLLRAAPDTWQARFERARQWILKEKSQPDKLLQAQQLLEQLTDQLEHFSAERITAELTGRITEVVSEADQMLSRLPQVELKQPLETFTIETAGLAKSRRDPEWNKYLLGKFGQDVIRADRVHGSLTLADGVSTPRNNSFEAARLVSLTAEQVLASLPDTLTTAQAVAEYVTAQVSSAIATCLNTMEGQGSTTVLATRYLPKLDSLVTIDIGDGQQVIVADDQVYNLRPPVIGREQPDIVVKTDWTRGIFRRTAHGQQHEVMVTSLADIRQQHPGAPLYLVQSSDGIKNNIGKNLHELPPTVLSGDLSSNLKKWGKNRDDITIGRLWIPSLPTTQS